MKISIPLIALILTSCASIRTVYVTEPLPIPVAPAYPVVTGAELECLSDDAYKRLQLNNKLKKDYIETLIDVIKSTHGVEDQTRVSPLPPLREPRRGEREQAA